MIHFKPMTLDDKNNYESYLYKEQERGCNYSFANLLLWGKQSFALLHEQVVLLSEFKGSKVYPYPIGTGDKAAVIDTMLADAKERGIPCKITAMTHEDCEELEKLFPGKFTFHEDRDSSDYVYAIDDLADLKGRKYHRKKNHFNSFQKAFPDYTAEPLQPKHLPQLRQMINNWYSDKLAENPEADYSMEQIALNRALEYYQPLAMEGLVLLHDKKILAFTLGSRLSPDTFDVHFEKAPADVPGAYAAINCEFARYIRSKYPGTRFLNREEDLGIPGLRKAKESYYPHHMVEKYWAKPKEKPDLSC